MSIGANVLEAISAAAVPENLQRKKRIGSKGLKPKKPSSVRLTIPQTNSTYLNNTKVQLTEPLSPSTRGLLGLASVLQWFPGPVAQAGQAAFKLSGGETFQNSVSKYYTNKAEAFVNPLVEPIKPELGAGYVLYKVYTTQSLTLPYHNYSLNLNMNSIAVNAKWDIR